MAAELKEYFLQSGALQTAAMNHDTFRVEHLLSKGFDVNWTNVCERTPLHMAAIENKHDTHYYTMETLLKHGANVNALDVYKSTPLHYLVGSANRETVQLLLNFHADVRLADEYCRTPLTEAIYRRNVEVVQLLVQQGSDVENIDKVEGSTPLRWACVNHCDPDIIKCLLKKGSNANSIDFEGRTPIMNMLARNHSEKLMKIFLKCSDINIVDLYGNNILCFEKSQNYYKIILEHVAKLQALELPIHQSILNNIFKEKEYKEYFSRCSKELVAAKNAKLRDCWVTFFNLLMDNNRKLKNFAGNKNLIKVFKRSKYLKRFPIYGPSMQKKVEKGLKTRKLYDESAVELSKRLPVFKPFHLVIRDVLDCLTLKDYDVFICEI